MAPLIHRRPLLIAGGAAVLVLLIAAFLWFRPDALFTDREVDEELDADVAAALAASPLPTGSATTPTTSVTPSEPTVQPPPIPSAAATTGGREATSRPETPAPSESGAPAVSDPVVLARGEWTALEHETTGTVALVDEGGDLQLVLTDLETSNGPDLHVILSSKAGVEGDWYGYEDGATYLGGLKGNRGSQVYDVPDDVDPADFASVVIWCERFSVGFGVANLA